MPMYKNRVAHRQGWWNELGLQLQPFPVPARHEDEIEKAALAVLSAHPPVGFAGGTDGDTITAIELRELVEHALKDAEQQAKRQCETADEERRRFGWAKLEQALADPDADQLILEGRWAGFRRGEAVAWCWNLFQYEPHGFVHPGSQVRHNAMKELLTGGLPEVFGYPKRARDLADSGLTPQEYRRHKEALGAKTFSGLDVMHSRA